MGDIAVRGFRAPSGTGREHDRVEDGYPGSHHVGITNGLDLLQAPTLDHGVERGKHLVEQGDQLPGGHPGRHRGETGDIGEKDRCLFEALGDVADEVFNRSATSSGSTFRKRIRLVQQDRPLTDVVEQNNVDEDHDCEQVEQRDVVGPGGGIRSAPPGRR